MFWWKHPKSLRNQLSEQFEEEQQESFESTPSNRNRIERWMHFLRQSASSWWVESSWCGLFNRTSWKSHLCTCTSARCFLCVTRQRSKAFKIFFDSLVWALLGLCSIGLYKTVSLMIKSGLNTSLWSGPGQAVCENGGSLDCMCDATALIGMSLQSGIGWSSAGACSSWGNTLNCN